MLFGREIVLLSAVFDLVEYLTKGASRYVQQMTELTVTVAIKPL